MVHIEDNVHILIVCVVNDLLNSVEPVALDRVSVHVLAPRYRYSDCVETGILYSRYHFLCCLGIAPARLCIETRLVCVVAFKRVAEIPADLDITDYLGSRAEVGISLARNNCGFLCCIRNRNRRASADTVLYGN